MNYWPLSLIARSPLCQHPGFLHELAHVSKTCCLSSAAFETCEYIVNNTPPVSDRNLVIVDTIDAPARYVYMHRPDFEDWAKLERVIGMPHV